MNVGVLEYYDVYCFHFRILHMKHSVRILELYESPLIRVASFKFDNLKRRGFKI
jgi:hypothetical protein